MKLNKILIGFRLGLGDIILFTPILRSLRSTYPESHITILVRPEFMEIAKRLPYISDAIAFDKCTTPMWKIIYQVYKMKYDAIFCLDHMYRTAVIPFFAGIPIRAGFKGKRGIFMTHSVSRPQNHDEIYETQNFANAITETLGILIKGDLTQLEFPVRNEQEKENVTKILKGIDNYIVIAPFSAGASKDWPLNYYQDLINKISQNTDMNIVIIGGKNQLSENLKNVINLIGKTSIMESAEITSRAKLFISGCCANIHIASAVGTPMVGLYGPTSILRWAPKNNIQIVKELPNCSPCFMKKDISCSKNICMTNISVQNVLNVSLKILNNLNPNATIANKAQDSAVKCQNPTKNRIFNSAGTTIRNI
jgi:heptosyltransferase-2